MRPDDCTDRPVYAEPHQHDLCPEQEGDLPEGVQPDALAHYLIALMQGLSVQAGAGTCCGDLGRMVDTALAMWPGR